jgi:hypothetical protein
MSIMVPILLLFLRSQLFNTHVSKVNQVVQKLFATLLGSLRKSYFIVMIIFGIVLSFPAMY